MLPGYLQTPPRCLLDASRYHLDTPKALNFIKLPADRGAGGRGEALRFAAPPKGEPGVLDYSACPEA